MGQTPLPRLPMSKALRTLIATVTAKPCEIATIPKITDGDKKVAADPPYTILYPLWSRYSGPIYSKSHSDTEWVYQASVAASRGDQIEVFHDKLVEAIVGVDDGGDYVHTLTVSGMSVMSRDLSDENGADGSGSDSTAGILTHDLRFSVTVTPSD